MPKNTEKLPLSIQRELKSECVMRAYVGLAGKARLRAQELQDPRRSCAGRPRGNACLGSAGAGVTNSPKHKTSTIQGRVSLERCWVLFYVISLIPLARLQSRSTETEK